MAAEFTCNQEIVAAARKNLSQDVWDYLTGAAESETSCDATATLWTKSRSCRACCGMYRR